jgi:hypothetical protein
MPRRGLIILCGHIEFGSCPFFPRELFKDM